MSRRTSIYEWLGLSEKRWIKRPNEEVRPAKTAWDWLQLLIVPLVLVALGYAFNASEAGRDRKREDARAAQAQFIARENRRDQTLQDYLARMGDLILNGRLRESTEASDVRMVARTLTLTVLRRLDGGRKGEVVRFLADSRLIKGVPPIVELAGADLSGVALRGVSLSGADFDAAALDRADFGASGLGDVSFEGARLQRASFAGAVLDGVDFNAAALQQASFRHARMGLESAGKRGRPAVVFEGACLTDAHFDGADARHADFTAAEGLRTSFVGARLTTDALRHARLGDLSLAGARISALPAGWDSHGAPLTASERRTLCRASAAPR